MKAFQASLAVVAGLFAVGYQFYKFQAARLEYEEKRGQVATKEPERPQPRQLMIPLPPPRPEPRTEQEPEPAPPQKAVLVPKKTMRMYDTPSNCHPSRHQIMTAKAPAPAYQPRPSYSQPVEPVAVPVYSQTPWVLPGGQKVQPVTGYR